MTASLDALTADLLLWIGSDARPYAEVLDAWRTSCPRLPVWEDAVERGYVAYDTSAPGEVRVRVTAAGRAFLAQQRPVSATLPR